ncbi:DUF3786 domain-containing protein [Murimonas intestini]|uniref:DUF3786 domain-containing protein n=1 Tax=Murimonas intestini TaxID=1337051 RepID=UPI0011DCFFF4|nr:DUF3786 domain-containing protein [Murimonas intestini]
MNIEYEKDNKERIPFEHYLEEYRKLDPLEVSSRTGIPYDKEQQCFTIRLMQKSYRISWPEFTVTREDKEDGQYAALKTETAAKIFVIRFLVRGVSSQPAGNYLTYREVPWGEVYFRQFQGRCIMRLAFSYGSKLDQFKAQMEKAGARELKIGDAAYEFEFINNHFVRFILWAGDDEFPPSAQILFSDNFPLSFEAEDLAVVGDISIGTLKKI